MKLFLTSSPCTNNMPEGVDLPCILYEDNEFVKNLEKHWKTDGRCVIISADPANFGMNDEMTDTFFKAFAYHGLTLSAITICDNRNAGEASQLLENSDVVVLAGGHVPTQMEFFRQIELKEWIRNYKGIVIGISAGTMNCANLVYAQPEEPGESIDPEYIRFFQGLGLTHINVLPHYQNVKNNILDGKRLFEDITYDDSIGKTFYALVDGSYILVENGKSVLYGEAYQIKDGSITQVCEYGNKIIL